MRIQALLAVVAMGLIGCGDAQKPAPAQPTATANVKHINPALVRVTKIEPPTGCTMLGTVQAGVAWSYDQALDNMRTKAAEMGADWLTLDYPTVARAFWCPPAVVDAFDAARNPAAPPPAPAAPAPYALLCEPDCSPGFACVRGQCVEACNPKCVAPQRCGADRICH
jgi:hypothetical protein